MNRRGFLGACLALGAAPAVVKASSLMRVKPPAGWVQSPTGGFVLPGKPLMRPEDLLPARGEVEVASINDIERLLTDFWGRYELRPTEIYVSGAGMRHLERLANESRVA